MQQDITNGITPPVGPIDEQQTSPAGVLSSTSGGTGKANAGTITNADDTEITGGGTLALGGFTATIPATGTVALKSAANTFNGTQTFSDAAGTGAGDLRAIAGQGIRIANSGGTGLTVDVNGATNLGNNLNCGGNAIKTCAILEYTSNTTAQITANTDNYALATSTFMRLSTDAARDLTGITGGVDGRTLLLVNVGAQNLVLKHQTTSTEANRILCSTGADITLSENQAADLIYDGTTLRWRAFKRN